VSYLQNRPKVDRPALLAEAKRIEIRARLAAMQPRARAILEAAKKFPLDSNILLDNPTNHS
jgi:hypothetical protein